jgi:cytochrome c oxidase subunit II
MARAQSTTGTTERRPWAFLSIAGFLALVLVCTAPADAEAATPLTYMVGGGSRNHPVVALIWGLIAISLMVVAIVTILLLVALLRRPDPEVHDPKLIQPRRPDRGLAWIYIGSAISGVALFGAALWTFAVLAAVRLPRNTAGFHIEVIGHQWWWEVRYEDKDPSRNIVTANEIHIPTGLPVRFVLSSGDVIHSFWVPALTGKTDTIPGQNNETWLEADKPGLYRGQCTEYCGQQHAHMGLTVTADQPADFQAWWNSQLKSAPPPATQQVAQGEAEFIVHCGICHTVRGTQAGGHIGPDLTHLMSRGGIAAETLPNTMGYLSAWISDPQAIKPGNLMPTLTISPQQLTALRSYMETLQ